MGALMGKAKQLKRDGAFDDLGITEVIIEGSESQVHAPVRECGIELVWDNKRVIRFGSAELLMDFLRKAA